jgi:hypothetical protein
MRSAEHHLGGPIMRQAAAAADPIVQSLWIQFAELNAMFMGKSPVAFEQVLRGITQNLEEPSSQSKAIPELLAISGKLVVLAKEIMKCRKSAPKPTPKRSSIQFKLSERFGNAELTTQN